MAPIQSPVKGRGQENAEEEENSRRAKKVYVGQPMTLVDRPSTHSLTNPRAVERYLDEMTLQQLILADK